MTQCILCKKRLAQHNKKECAQCFTRRIEHSVRKEIRASKVMAITKEIVIIGKKDASSKVLERIASQIANQQRKKAMVLQNEPKLNKQNKRVLNPATMDELNTNFMKKVLGEKNKEENQTNFIFPLEKITQEECELYCKIKKIEFNKTKSKNDIEEFLQRIENTQPGTNFALSITRKNLHGKK